MVVDVCDMWRVGRVRPVALVGGVGPAPVCFTVVNCGPGRSENHGPLGGGAWQGALTAV